MNKRVIPALSLDIFPDRIRRMSKKSPQRFAGGGMKLSAMPRRAFLQTTALAATALATGACHAMAEGSSRPIGCFNRPWMQKFGSKAQPLDTPQPANWGFDAALKGIQQAGYQMAGLLTPMPEEPFIGSQATDEYLTNLKRRIAGAGVAASMGAFAWAAASKARSAG